MEMKINFILTMIMTTALISCGSKEDNLDASGFFEATEIVVSAEANGVIKEFSFEEGDIVALGEIAAKIESSDLELNKEQIEATIETLGQKKNEYGPQVVILEKQLLSAISNLNTLQTQLQILEKEQNRIKNLFQSKAATGQQKDEIDGKVQVMKNQIETANSNVDVIRSQINSAKRQVAIQNRGIASEKKPLQKQIEQVEYRMDKSRVENPVTGTLLTKYAFAGEFVNVGKPLYRIADLREMELRAYIDGNQLSQIKIGQIVNVYIDKDQESYYEYPGTITWISDKAEFTPKSIQMKDERANLVYAIKVKVKNDGKIKIGMYGEIAFDVNKAK
jgi:HlyD family secretion protein